MKKHFLVFSFAAALLFLVGCGSAASEKTPAPSPEATAVPTPEATQEPTSLPGKTLVAYFSWSGNTEDEATYIAETLGADLYRIEPETPYPTDYEETGALAETERDTDARPAVANLPENLDAYDNIVIAYPIWWHTAPMIVGSFLEHYDLTGKELYPVSQSASMNEEQFAESVSFVARAAPGATVHDGLFTAASNTEGIDRYLAESGLQGAKSAE